MKTFTFLVEKQFNNFSVLDFLKSQQISLEIIKKVKFGGIFINEELITNINKKVSFLDKVKLVLPKDKINEFITPIKGELKILYEDDYLLVVFKPSGVLTHSSKHNKSVSLEGLFYSRYKKEGICFRPVNRLDKDTSGLVLISKDILTASLLGEQLKNGGVEKIYQAVVVGTPVSEHFIIEKPIKRQSETGVKRTCSEDGQYAKTECFFVKKIGDNASLIKVKLHTGRTHQIRVHLSSIGLPLYADALYGKKIENKTYVLRASSLKFTHPIFKKEIISSCPLELNNLLVE